MLGYLQGLIGVLLFIVISQDYEASKVIRFEHLGSQYETRCYTHGFVTEMDTKYTFVTYKKYKFIPVEEKIDDTIIFNISDYNSDKLAIRLKTDGNLQQIEFVSPTGILFTKILNR